MPVISGGGGGAASGLRQLYNTTLAAPAATIDTGANAIAAGHGVLTVLMLLRTTEAGAISNALLTLNADTGANYDIQGATGNNATVAASGLFGQTSVGIIVHGAGGTASYPGMTRLTVPFYDATTFFKVCEFAGGAEDGTAANNWYTAKSFTWRNAAAISRLTLTTTSGNFIAGCQVVILGSA